MTANEYRKALEQLGLSIIGAAQFLGVSKRQSQYYAAGETPIPKPVSILLVMYLEHGLPSRNASPEPPASA